MVVRTETVVRGEALIQPKPDYAEILFDNPKLVSLATRVGKNLFLTKDVVASGPRDTFHYKSQHAIGHGRLVMYDEYSDFIVILDVFDTPVIKKAGEMFGTLALEPVTSKTRENALRLVLRASKAPFNEANIHSIKDQTPDGPFLYLKAVRTANGLMIKRKISRLQRENGYARLRSNGHHYIASWQNPEPDVLELMKAGPVKVTV